MADLAVAVHVAVVDRGHKPHLRRSLGVIWAKLGVEKEVSANVGGRLGSLQHDAPECDVFLAREDLKVAVALLGEALQLPQHPLHLRGLALGLATQLSSTSQGLLGTEPSHS